MASHIKIPKFPKRLPLDVTVEMEERIDAFRYRRRYKVTSEALRELVEKGLQTVAPELNADGALASVTPTMHDAPLPAFIGSLPEHMRPYAERFKKKALPERLWPGDEKFSNHKNHDGNHRIPASVWDQLRWVSEKYGVHKARLVEVAICDFLDRELPLLGVKRVRPPGSTAIVL